MDMSRLSCSTQTLALDPKSVTRRPGPAGGAEEQHRELVNGQAQSRSLTVTLRSEVCKAVTLVFTCFAMVNPRGVWRNCCLLLQECPATVRVLWHSAGSVLLTSVTTVPVPPSATQSPAGLGTEPWRSPKPLPGAQLHVLTQLHSNLPLSC